MLAHIAIEYTPKGRGDLYGYWWHMYGDDGNVICWSGQGYEEDYQRCAADAQLVVQYCRRPDFQIVHGNSMSRGSP